VWASSSNAIDPAATMNYVVRVPQINLATRVGLPAGFSVIAQATTIVVQNEVVAGAAWSTGRDAWSLMLAVQGGALFVGLNGFGFDAFTAAPLLRPGATLGSRFGDVFVSLRGEVLVSSPL
jgi:hypothetical protein